MIEDYPEMITVEAALSWIMVVYEMPRGPAEAVLGTALAAGTIRTHLKIAVITEPCPTHPYGKAELVDQGCRERLNFTDLKWQIRQQRGEPGPPDMGGQTESPAAKVHRGGAPPVVREAVVEWWNKLPEEDRNLPATKLSDIFAAKGGQGSERAVRGIIGELKKTLAITG